MAKTLETEIAKMLAAATTEAPSVSFAHAGDSMPNLTEAMEVMVAFTVRHANALEQVALRLAREIDSLRDA